MAATHVRDSFPTFVVPDGYAEQGHGTGGVNLGGHKLVPSGPLDIKRLREFVEDSGSVAETVELLRAHLGEVAEAE